MTSKTTTNTRRDHGSGSITVLPSGSVRIRYRVDGKTLSETFKQEGPGEQGTARALVTAKRRLRRVEAAIEAETFHDPRSGDTRLEEYAAAWVKGRRVQGAPLKPKTAVLYRGQLSKWIIPTLGRSELRKINTARVRAWHAELTDAENGAGPTGAPKVYKLLKAILTTAVEDGEIQANPCTIKGAGSEPVNPRPDVELDDVLAIAAAVPERYRAVVLVGAFCGLRFGEMSALQRRDVDLMHGVIRVRRTAGQVQGMGRVVREATKNGTHRVVAIPSNITDDLEHHLATYAAPEAQGSFFCGPKGGALHSNNFAGDVWRPALKATGLADLGLHVHDLRHHAATSVALAGGSVSDVKALLGHKSDAMAIRYTQSSPARQAELAEKVAERVRLATVHPLRTDKIIAN